MSIRSAMKIAEAATRHAFQAYWDMSDGYWLSSAPEYYLTVKVAEALHAGGLGPISLEEGRTALMTGCGIKDGRVRRDKELRDGGRCDIVLWAAGDDGSEERPRAAIEVKTAVYSFGQIRNDLRFMFKMMEKAPSFEFGVLICQLRDVDSKKAGDAKRIVSEGARRLRESASALCADKGVVLHANQTPVYYSDDHDATGVLVLGLSRKRR